MTANIPRSALTAEDVRKVSPALEHYRRNSIEQGLWKRPDLSPRDRSIVTASALIARNQTIGMLHYFNIALDNNVTPSELSEIATHLAFYSGWSNAFGAVRHSQRHIRATRHRDRSASACLAGASAPR